MPNDIKRVDQGSIVAINGDVDVELTKADYPTPPIKEPHPAKDTRVDLITGTEQPIRILR